MASFVNGCVFTATSSGTGSFVVSAAVTGWQTPAQAGAINGATYRYRAYSADNTQWEIGSGVYTTGTVTLTRAVIEASSNSGSATNFTLPPAVALTMFDEDIVPFSAPTFTGIVTGGGFVPSASVVPTNGMYLPAANTLGWAINSGAEVQLTATAFSPAADGGNSLGTTALGWQNLFGNTGFVWNIEGGNWVATHTSGIVTVGTGDLRVTTAGTNAASVVTVGGSQTLTGKTLTSPVLTTPNIGAATGTSLALSSTISGTQLTLDSLTNAVINKAFYANTAFGVREVASKSRGATIGANVIVQNGDELWGIFAQGANGTGYTQAGFFGFYVDGTPGASNDMPTRFAVGTTPDGAGAAITGFGLSQSGAVQYPLIGTTASAANAFLDSGASNNLLRSTSSLAYKTDVERVDPAYSEALLQLEPIYYKSLAKADNPDWSWWGFAAEEVAAVDPRLVTWGFHEDDYEVVTIPGPKSVTKQLKAGAETQLRYRPEDTEVRKGKTVPKEGADAVLAYGDEDFEDVESSADRAELRVKEGAVKKPDGVMYDRLPVHHHVIIKQQQARLRVLEFKVAELTKLLKK